MPDITDDVRCVRRVQPLVHYCQRVLNANIDGITGLGGEMPYRLVEPILRGCSADTLLRIELETPHILEENEDLWQHLCHKNYPILAQEYTESFDRLASWREVYDGLKAAEAKRLEHVSLRMRKQRQEAEELKKVRQVKLTDRIPPMKRPRWNNTTTSTQSKSLFQKTRVSATKIQNSVYGARMLPPMPPSKTYRPNVSSTGVSLSLDSESSMTPVKVTTIIHRKPITPSSSPPLPRASIHQDNSQHSSSTAATTMSGNSSPALSESPLKPTQSYPESRVSARPTGSPRKDPMATLFMPKRRAYSQLPHQVQPTRSLS